MVNSENAYTVHHYEEVTSTNDVASSFGKEGAAHLTAVTADAQTAGRGRRGRNWVTTPASSIACSVVVRGADDKLPLVAAVALCKALKKFAPACNIKWPNDILIEGKKVCGLLVEGVSASDTTEAFHILGFGVNVLDSEDLPDVATALQAHKSVDVAVSREDVLQSILAQLDKTLTVYGEEGWEYIAMEYQAMCGSFGREVTWYNGKGVAEIFGESIALDKNGALIIRQKDGTLCTVNSGEIIAQGKVL